MSPGLTRRPSSDTCIMYFPWSAASSVPDQRAYVTCTFCPPTAREGTTRTAETHQLTVRGWLLPVLSCAHRNLLYIKGCGFRYYSTTTCFLPNLLNGHFESSHLLRASHEKHRTWHAAVQLYLDGYCPSTPHSRDSRRAPAFCKPALKVQAGTSAGVLDLDQGFSQGKAI